MSDDSAPVNDIGTQEGEQGALVGGNITRADENGSLVSETSGRKSESGQDASEVERALNYSQNLPGIILATGAFATASGFLVVNSFLGRYDYYASLTILPAQYIGAGITLWIFLVPIVFIALIPFRILGFISQTREHQRKSIVLLEVPITARILRPVRDFFAIRFVKYKLGIQRINQNLFANYVSQESDFSASKYSRRRLMLLFSNFLFWFLLVLVVEVLVEDNIYVVGQITLQSFLMNVPLVAGIMFLLDMISRFLSKFTKIRGGLGVYYYTVMVFIYGLTLVLFYGRFAYGTIPKGWGGGAPFLMHVYLEKDATDNYMGISVDESGKSEPVCLLAELYDGLLIYNPRTRISFSLATSEQTAYIGHAASDENINCLPTKCESAAPLKMAKKNDADQASSEEITACT